MQLLTALALGVRFLAGAVVGLLLAIVFAPVSFFRAGRAVHKDGIVVRAELSARNEGKDHGLGAVLAGPAWVRLSGAMGGSGSGKSDVLGLALRMRRPCATVPDDPEKGDQDVLFGTFESFTTAARDRAKTVASDYLANRYSTVTPWWVKGKGPCKLRLAPDSSTTKGVNDRRSSASAASGPDAVVIATGPSQGEAANRLRHLDEAIAEDRARFIVILEQGKSSTEIAELRLTERTSLDGRRLRASMFRAGRGIRAVGFRNGIRATLYPLSQLARRVRAR